MRADTPTGDPTQMILIDSHSDSVAAGPGINDNSLIDIKVVELLQILFLLRHYIVFFNHRIIQLINIVFDFVGEVRRRIRSSRC